MILILVRIGAAHAAQLSLTWSDTSTNEEGFKLERKTGSAGAYGLLASLAAETTGYVDTTVTAGTTYCYRVRAYNSAGDSAYSNEACAAPASATLYTVAVTKSGTGSGTVTSSPNAIDCGSTCSANIASGTSLAVSATPTSGSTFSGWSGACAGTGTCTLVVDANRSLTATFALNTPTTYALTVTKSGTGNGAVTSTSAAGITCGSDCTENYSSGTAITLTAAPATGSTFTGWSGACTGTTNTCTVSMTTARSVTATFTAQTYALTVTPSGTGSGTVSSVPAGVTCGTDCTETYNYSTSVTVTAAASAGSTFTGWSGACTGTTNTCTVSMTTARSVTATFALAQLPSTYALNVAKNGAGAGIVASDPAGINCGAACNANFSSGAIVALQAMPEPGSTFTGWSGACSGTGPCSVNMTQARSVTATFALQSVTLTVTNTRTDLGRVSSNPAGISCGTACSLVVPSGSVVTLTATPTKRAAFVGWGGACAGTGACTVTLTQAKNVTATFQRKGRR